ncbi:MAG: mechanosensitive ion channel family protein [Lachnospirales bacterium]
MNFSLFTVLTATESVSLAVEDPQLPVENLEETVTGLSGAVKMAINGFLSPDFWINILVLFLQIFLVIVFAKIIIKILNYFVGKFMSKSKYIDHKKEATLVNVSKATIKIVVYFTAIITILKMFNISVESLIAVAGVGSLAIGFAAQNLVRDFITGMFILLENQYNIGDLVALQDIKGVVENITMRVTTLRSVDGSLHYIPNGEIKLVTNLSKEYSRAIVEVGVDYNADIDLVLEVLESEMEKADRLIEELLLPPVVLGISDLADNSVNIKIMADCKAGEAVNVERKLRLLIKKRLDKENISIPFPQRVIHIVKEW